MFTSNDIINLSLEVSCLIKPFHQTADRAAYLKLAETLTAFLERLRTNAQTLDIGQRQRIMRLLVKEVIVGKDLITIKHSIPGHSATSGGNPQSSKSPV